jgi:hypothetical protein
LHNDFLSYQQIKNNFIVFHQNIQGLYNTQHELLNSLASNPLHILNLTDHHLSNEELDNTALSQYFLGANFYRQIHKHGGMCTFVLDDIQFSDTKLMNAPKRNIFKFVL